MSPDYGVDFQVEVVDDETGDVTGIQFYVQLKSTRRKHRETLSQSIDLDDLNYWKGLALPVLIVIADLTQKELRFRWAHDLDPFNRAEAQRTMRFPFRSEDRWQTATHNELHRYAAASRAWREKEIRFPVSLSIRSSNEPGALTEQAVRNALRAELEPQDSLIRLNAQGQIEVEGLILKCERNETRIALPGTPHLVIDHSGGANWDPRFLGPELVTAIAVTLGRAGYPRAAARLAAVSVNRVRIDALAVMAVPVAMLLADGGMADDAIAFAEGLETAGQDWLQGWVMSYLSMSDSLDDGHRDRLLAAQLERFKRLEQTDSHEAATAAYNIAGHYRASSLHQEAVDWYERAAALNPDYRHRDYWNRELGGMLFLLGRFEDSTQAYAAAKELGDDYPLISFLYADALMHSGRYAEAAKSLGDIADLTGPQGVEAQLMLAGLETLVNELAIPEQQREPERALRLCERDSSAWRRALALDGLCPLAWKNKGMSENSTETLAIGAAMDRYNAQLWAAALLACAFADQHRFGRDLAGVARRYVGIELVEVLREFHQSAQFSQEVLDSTLAWYDAAEQSWSPGTIIRIHDSDFQPDR